MEKRLVKVCYECDAAFSLLTRRRRCGLCGRVFCTRCTPYQVPAEGAGPRQLEEGEATDGSGLVRACRYCYQTGGRRRGSVDAATGGAMGAGMGGGITQGGEARSSDAGGNDGGEVAGVSGELGEGLLVLEGQSAPASGALVKNMRWQDFTPRTASQSQDGQPDVPGAPPERADAPEAGRPGFANPAEPVPYPGGSVKDHGELSPRSLADSPIGSPLKKAMFSVGGAMDECGTWKVPPPMPAGESSRGALDGATSAHTKALDEVCKAHLRHFISGLQVDTGQFDWRDVLGGLAEVAAKSLSPSGPSLDPRAYFMVKRIPSGEPSDSALYSGAVFKKNVANKKMRRDIDKPSLALIGGSLEYQRTNTRLSSLDTLQTQELEHLRLQVAQIILHKPDIVFVERSVARYAQELLLEARVTLVLNVKPKWLEHIALLTGAKIAMGAHELTEEHLGTCARFYTQTFKCGEHAGVQGGKPEPATRTLMFLNGCKSSLGGTIVLQGADRVTLRALKEALQKILLVAYSMKVESSFILKSLLASGALPAGEKFTQRLRELTTRVKAVNAGLGKASISPFVPFCPPAGFHGPEEGDELNLRTMGQLYVTVASCCPEKNLLCEPRTMHKVGFFSDIDFHLGAFFQAALPEEGTDKFCPNERCREGPEWHLRTYVHGRHKLTMAVSKLPEGSGITNDDKDVWMWSSFKRCKRKKKAEKHPATWRVRMDGSAREMTLGRFLSIFLAPPDLPDGCGHSMFLDRTHWFATRQGIARFDIERLNPYEVEFPPAVISYDPPLTAAWMRKEREQLKEEIEIAFADLSNCVERIYETAALVAAKAEEKAASETSFSIKSVVNSLEEVRSSLPSDKASIEAAEIAGGVSSVLSSLGLPEEEGQPLQDLYQINARRAALHSCLDSIKKKLTYVAGVLEKRVGPVKTLSDLPRAQSQHHGGSLRETAQRAAGGESPASTQGSPKKTELQTVRKLQFEAEAETSPHRRARSLPASTFDAIAETAVQSERRGSVITGANEEFSGRGLGWWNIPMPLKSGQVRLRGRLVPGSGGFIFSEEPTSAIACALLMPQYRDQLAAMRSAGSLDKLRAVPKKGGPQDTPDKNFSHLLTQEASHVKLAFESMALGTGLQDKCSITAYFPLQFSELRALHGVEEAVYIQSLFRCQAWDSKGGKSSAYFAKSLDDRYIIKQLSKTETNSFLELAPLYFRHLAAVMAPLLPQQQRRSCLVRILGAYQVVIRPSPSAKAGARETKMDVVVMENVFYARKVGKIFDLKGSIRSRYNSEPETNPVLLDENLLEGLPQDPVLVEQSSRHALDEALWADTSFLGHYGIMDYSLLVGIADSGAGESREGSKGQIVLVGIIDFLRQYTWDKQLETWVKSSGFLGGGGKVPTIISPVWYMRRFRLAMRAYFTPVPTCEPPPETLNPDSMAVPQPFAAARRRSARA